MSEEKETTKKTTRKTGLGRGLGSLLGGGMDDVQEEGFQEKSLHSGSDKSTQAKEKDLDSQSLANRVLQIPIEQLVPNKEQPRKEFEPDELKELSESIREKGVIQPIIARKKADKEFQIIAGERRWRASALAGLKKLPVILRESDPQEVLELALIENIQREDLNPMEEAEAYQVLSQKYQLTQKDIAQKVGKERATVANIMRLLQLSKEVREMVKQGDIQIGQAKALMAIQDMPTQKKVAKQVVKKDLSVRALESLVKKLAEGPVSDVDLELDKPTLDQSLVKELSAELQRALGTKVKIDFAGRRGKIQIDFYSVEELNNIVDGIRGR